MLVANGKYVIPTLDWDDANIPAATFQQACIDYANALQGLVSAIEIGNEPVHNAQWNDDGTGSQFARLRDAIPRFHAKGIKVIMGSPPTGPDRLFLAAADANGVLQLVDGFSLHPYSSVPGSGGSGLANPGTQLGWVKARRDQVDGYGAPNAEILITEHGWGTEAPGGSPANLLCPGATKAAREAKQEEYLTQAYTNWVAYASSLKLRAACWFWWMDCSAARCTQMPVVFRNCGLRTTGAGWYYKNGGAQDGQAGIRAALASFQPVYDLTDPPPTAVTISAINETKFGARLRGSADPNGTATSVGFDWGITTGFGNTTPMQPVGNGSVPVSVFADIAGLQPDTTYHYRTRAVNTNASVSLGSPLTFKTLVAPLPPTVTTGPPTTVKPTGATLTGVIDPNDLPTTWHFEYGPTTSYGTSTPEKNL